MTNYNLNAQTQQLTLLNTSSNSQLLKPESTINSEYQSQQSPNQVKPGQMSTDYNISGRGLKTIDGVLMSWCGGHKTWHPVSEFSINRSRRCGFQKQCKEISAAYWKAKRDRPIPEGTLCAFENCSRLAITRDHDHTTGQFRGFLCNNHNVMLGHGDDNVQDLLDGIKYLTPL